MFKKTHRLVLFGLLLLAIAGCQSGPKSSRPVTPLLQQPQEQQNIPSGPPSSSIQTQQIARVESPPVFQPAPAVQTELKPQVLLPQVFTNKWIALEGWSMGYIGTRPQKITPNAIHSYQIKTADGVLGLTVGSRIVTWQGLAFWLGYGPQIMYGKPHIHWIDALKTLMPLVNPSPQINAGSRILILDPGHGGRSVGTQNIITKQYEKEYTLDWAMRIKSLLSTNGWTVVLTRTNDVDTPIAERIAIADRHKGDLFISLHFNSANPDREMSGLETYCLTPCGMPSSITREFEDDIAARFPNNAFDAQNLQLSLQLHKELVRSTGGLDRAIRRARFMGVLRGQNRPAVLIEGGYLSNPVEARKIATPYYRQKLAEAIAKALK